jgi:CheY-like chemotaxis protein
VEKKGLFLRVEGSDDLPQVYCDATRIQQVILNLVSNAARFTAKGGITVRVEQEDQHVVVSVTDTGMGISAADAERIFEPFCQGVGDMWRDKGGSGLGLTISKQFVQLHGGEMWLESELGVGSSFLFKLPISPSAGHIARPGHQIREDWVWRERAFRTDRVGLADRPARPRLVIFDETNSLSTQFAGYSDLIEHVETHDLAQIAVALEQCPAHAVVLNAAIAADLWPMVESARTAISDTPIVGYSVPRPITRAVEAGAMGYLTKPVTQADLEEAIESVGKPLRRVLVVDDNPDVLRLFTRMLHVCDDTLSVATAASGEQALEELHSKPFDLVLLDVVMPGMDGWEVLERLRQGDRTAKLPVLFVSAQDLVDQPPESKLLVTTVGEGLSISQLLRCSLALPELLLKPVGEPGPEPLQTAKVRPAWVGREQRPEPVPDPLP